MEEMERVPGLVRPTGEQVFADMAAHQSAHPRIFATSATFDRIRRLYEENEAVKDAVDKIVASARENLEKDFPPYGIDEGGRFKPCGCEWLEGWAFSYRITGEECFLRRSVELARNLGDPIIFPDWCPAHYLNCAAVAFYMSISYDWLFPELTEEERDVYETALHRNAIKTALGSYAGTTEGMNQHGLFGRSGWTQTTNNWNAVCNGSLTLACLAIGDVPAYHADAAELMTDIMQSIEIGIRCYAPDGSYEESPGYWAYGTGHLFAMCEALYSAAGTTYGLMEAEGIKETCYYALHIESPDCGCWNYHDSGASKLNHSHFLWVGQYLGDTGLVKLRYDEIVSGRRPAGIRDLLDFPEEEPQGDAALPTFYCSKGIQTAVFRSSFAPGSLYTGLHGGYNSVNHGDIDAGSFIYDDRGVRFICDLGGDCYNMPGYFGKGIAGASFRYYRKGAEGHNTIVIADDPAHEMRFGQNPLARIPVARFSPAEGGGIAVLNMKDAYGENCLTGLRGMAISDDYRKTVVQDEITFRDPRSFYWFAHTTGEIELSEDGRCARLTVTREGQEPRSLYVRLIGLPGNKFTVMKADGVLPSNDPYEKEYSRDGFRKLAIYVERVRSARFAVVISGSPEAEYELKDIVDW